MFSTDQIELHPDAGLCFINRFDTGYLTELKRRLSLQSLKDTALDRPKEINGITYRKCINIDFCGLAGTTLFDTNPEDKNVTKENLELRREIAEAFHHLMTKETLKMLNEDTKGGPFYLRIRFCFSYLYSDYPICLIRAEDSEVWEKQASRPIDNYYLNLPVDQKEFESSKTYIHQRNSLKEIIEILKRNKDLVYLEETGKMENTIQVRFNAIPSPVCCLLINNTAFCDAYMYAKAGDQLSLNYPVAILDGNNKRQEAAFTAVKDHFYYLWRHDLTLFCRDATAYKPEKKGIAGLIEVLPPDIVAGPGGTDWSHKTERIWERMKGKDVPKSAEDIAMIEAWKMNVKSKFLSCTRKMIKVAEPEKRTTIWIGMKKKYYYFKIVIPGHDTVFEYLDGEANITFIALAHYCYAVWRNKGPVMHHYYVSGKAKLLTQLKQQLDGADLDKSNAGTRLFGELFIEKNNSLALKLPEADIVFEFDERIAGLRYNADEKKFGYKATKGCLEYSNEEQPS